MPTMRGSLDVVDRDLIEGWARNDDQPDRPVTLRISVNGDFAAQVSADLYRADLREAGIGAGRHAFSFRFTERLTPERRHLIEVCAVHTGVALPGSPRVLEAAGAAVVLHEAPPAPWRGHLDVVTRERIEGWAFDETLPQTPVALAFLSNGKVIARALANRYRDDLRQAGMGDGRHGFAVHIPSGLSPVSRHVIQVLGESDGCEMPGSPITLEAASAFDAALERAVSTAVSALALPADRERALGFLAAQTERLLQAGADADAGREARHIHQQFERRWGRSAGLGAVRSPALDTPPRPRALVIDELPPVPSRDAGSAAILSHMRALQALGYDVSFVAGDDLSPSAQFCAQFEGWGIEFCRTPYYASVEEVLRRQADTFDVVYLHRVSSAAQYLALARRHCAGARIVYSVADLHHLRFARAAQIEGRPELLAQSRRLRLAECNAASTANAILTHSTFEAAWLRQAVTGCNVHVVPWAVPVKPTARPWNERRGIAFIGNYSHAPNVDAARFLAEHIMPQLRVQDPAIECLLVGSNMPESIKPLAAPGIVPLGHVPELGGIFERVRLTVAPLRYGAGVKGKVLESWAAGVPCIMSPTAAEGIPLPEMLTRLIAPDAARITADILRLHSDEAECDRLRQAGLEFIAAGYDEATVVAGLEAAIQGRRPASESRAGVESKGGLARTANSI